MTLEQIREYPDGTKVRLTIAGDIWQGSLRNDPQQPLALVDLIPTTEKFSPLGFQEPFSVTEEMASHAFLDESTVIFDGNAVGVQPGA